jgi:hypothetical protein
MHGDLERVLSIKEDESADVIDSIEPVEVTNEFREASKQCLTFLNSLLDYLASYQTPRELEARLWIVLSSFAHPAIEGLNLMEFGQMLELSRANFLGTPT